MRRQTYALTSRKGKFRLFAPQLSALPSAARLLLILLALCVAFPAFAEKAPVCVKGTPEPKSPIIPRIRPIQTAQCPYGFDEFVARLTALATDTQSLDSVETVRGAFGLPDMTTGYDHRRIAAYALDISGKGGWTAKLGVSEAFYPLDKGPTRFVPGPHPKRLYKAADASLRIDLRVFKLAHGGGVQCVPVPALQDALEKAGWTKMKAAPSDDGSGPATGFQYANKAVSITAECSKRAPQTIALWQEPAKH